MDFGFDPFAFALASFAIWFSLHESKKSNKVMIKVMDCKTTERANPEEYRGGIFSELKVLIRNQGISLHDVQLSLDFRDMDGFGAIHVPLKRRDERTGEHSEFSRGMIAEFSLRSYEIEPVWAGELGNLVDLAGQDARLTLFSQGYVAETICIGRLRDRLAFQWNQLAYRLNSRFDRTIDTPHGQVLKLGNLLPQARNLSIPVRFFIQQVKVRRSQMSGRTTPTG